jgi:hypothetical protein
MSDDDDKPKLKVAKLLGQTLQIKQGKDELDRSYVRTAGRSELRKKERPELQPSPAKNHRRKRRQGRRSGCDHVALRVAWSPRRLLKMPGNQGNPLATQTRHGGAAAWRLLSLIVLI